MTGPSASSAQAAASRAPARENTTGIAAGQLRSYVERIERLHEEKDSLLDDIRDIYAELKGNGFDARTVKEVVKLRRLDNAERQERDALLDVYLHALGMGGGG